MILCWMTDKLLAILQKNYLDLVYSLGPISTLAITQKSRETRRTNNDPLLDNRPITSNTFILIMLKALEQPQLEQLLRKANRRRNNDSLLDD